MTSRYKDRLRYFKEQERFMAFAKQFLKPTGVFFIGFPPWQNPFGGHQQVVGNKFLSHLPWFHLLPRGMYERILRRGGVNPQGLLEIKDTGISLERLNKIIKREGYTILEEILFFINPNYEVKFKLKPRKLWKLLNIPYIRNFYTTCGYYLISID